MGKITSDRNEIIKWAEDNGAKPAMIDNGGGGASRFVRFKFSSNDDQIYLSNARKSIDTSWEDFFKVFEEKKLEFYYDTEYKGDPSMNYRFMPKK